MDYDFFLTDISRNWQKCFVLNKIGFIPFLPKYPISECGAVLYLLRVTLLIMNFIAMFKHSLHLKGFCCLSQSTGGTHTLNLIQAAGTLFK